mgnify:CR=1 FL=1
MFPTQKGNEENHKEKQILKCRDDKEPIILLNQPKGTFMLDEESSCSWLKKGEQVDATALRKRIEPWLTALFQSEHFSLLIGSGLTHAVHHLATNNDLPGMSTAKFSVFEEEINNGAIESCKKSGRGEEVNLEDQIRVANELLTGLKHFCGGKSDGDLKELKNSVEILEKDIKTNLGRFAQSILDGEKELAEAPADKREKAFNYLVNFLMSFASRSGTRDRLNIFTTNYDRIIEAGAELAGLHLLDRFVGNLFPIFRSSRLNVDMHYNPPGIRGEPRYLEGVAYFTKLHGSVDWINVGRDIRRIGLPFGAADIDPYLNLPGISEVNALKIMIYPNSAKDRETTLYPYVELFRDFAAAICRPNHTLVVFGYSFGDEHINRVIEDMLTIPSTHLVIISFDDQTGRIRKKHERIGRYSQCTLMIGNHLGDLKTLVDYYLPKPAIDWTTYRMAELIKKRLEATPLNELQIENNSGTNNGTEDQK